MRAPFRARRKLDNSRFPSADMLRLPAQGRRCFRTGGHESGPAFLKIRGAVLYPFAAIEAWDRMNLLIYRASKVPSGKELEEA